MLNEMSAAIKKLLTVFTFFPGWPTYLGDDAAVSKQIQQSIKVSQPKKFLDTIHALFFGFCPDTSAAQKKKGAISPDLLFFNAGKIQKINNGSGNNKNTQLYAISKCIGCMWLLFFAQAAEPRSCNDTDCASLKNIRYAGFFQSRLRRDRTAKGVLCRNC
jgi:hypothetical protein